MKLQEFVRNGTIRHLKFDRLRIKWTWYSQSYSATYVHMHYSGDEWPV